MPKFTIPTFLFFSFLFFTKSATAQTFNTTLGTFTTNGTPNYLVANDPVSDSLTRRIKNSLPERYNVPQYNPQYLDTTLTHDLKVIQETDVWVTFVDEGAGYKNVLTFYTYDVNNPPTTKPTNLTVVFPNMSLENNVLRVGNKVRLGRFPANTGIGIALIADGFRNGVVTKGNNIFYSNPLFNPEPKREHKQHSVLLRDASNVLVMGFEDLVRTNGNGDNDFNDAVFYFTAEPGAVSIGKIPLTVGSGSTGVSSGNLGGLESDGCLAQAIAHRNFVRTKTPSLSFDNFDVLPAFKGVNMGALKTRGENELAHFIPENPLFDPTFARTTTPSDLMGITNAQKVLSVDYFDATTEQRVAAILTTQTNNRVYDHTKVICDRLAGSTLLGTEKIMVNNLPLVRSTLRRADGVFEYAIHFSLAQNKSADVDVLSRWGIESYPEKTTYFNYQIWAEAPYLAQKVAEEVLTKASTIFTKLNEDKELQTPPVFVKNGYYDNGVLTLNIHNPLNANSLTIKGNLTTTETSERQNFDKTVALSGQLEQTVSVAVGSLLDLGFSIVTEKSPIADALYFADGAWGLDFEKNVEKISDFKVKTPQTAIADKTFTLERDPSVSATVKGYVSLFRSLKAAGEAANLEAYKNLSFEATGNGIVEVTLVKKSIKEWGKQFRTEFLATSEKRAFNLPLTNFKNEAGETLKADDILDVVFTIKGDGKTEKNVELALQSVVFDDKIVKNIVLTQKMMAFPNPATDFVELQFDLGERQDAELSLSNLSGQVQDVRTLTFAKGRNAHRLNIAEMPTGIYIATLRTQEGVFNTKILVD